MRLENEENLNILNFYVVCIDFGNQGTKLCIQGIWGNTVYQLLMKPNKPISKNISNGFSIDTLQCNDFIYEYM